MTTAIATKSDSTLDTLAGEIDQAHAAAQAAATTAIDHARRAGELLIEAKASLPHGRFLPWLAENVIVSERQARRYMTLAAGWDVIANRTREADLTIRGALELLAPTAETAIEDEITEMQATEEGDTDRATGNGKPPARLNPALRGTRHPEPNRMTENLAAALSGLAGAAEDIDIEKLNHERVPALAASLAESLKVLNRIHREIGNGKPSEKRKPSREPEWLKSIEIERVESVLSAVVKGWKAPTFAPLIAALKRWIQRMEDEDAARAVEAER